MSPRQVDRLLRSPIPRRRQSHKVFVGGLPQNVTEGELLHYFEKEAGPVADVLILKVRRSPPVDPLVSICGVERRAEFSALGPRAGCLLALGSGSGLAGTASVSR